MPSTAVLDTAAETTYWKMVFNTPEVHPFDTIKWVKADACIKSSKGVVVFEQKDVEVPEFWNQTTINIVADKYFRMIDGVRENSAKQMFSRVAKTLRAWGEKQNFFYSEAEAEIYEKELLYALVHQYGAFNSPVWFNLGVPGRRQAASACFISSVDDSLESIFEFQKAESTIFAGGSGSGANLSKIRSSYEKLSSGAYTSGPLSWMRGLDQYAMAMKSGGSCLAPHQRVYTERGPIRVKELAESNQEFIVLSYDPPANRFKAKKATAWFAGQKEVVRVKTDKGQFDFSVDHPFKLSTGEYVRADELKPGMSLFNCTINDQAGYVRVNLKNGKKGREKFHRMIVNDILDLDLDGLSVHHKDGNKYNNDVHNLEVLTDSEHVKKHSDELVASRSHIFQNRVFSRLAEDNPMYETAEFWKDETRVNICKGKKREQLIKSGNAALMQKEASAHKIMQTGYKLINLGGDISTFGNYAKSRRALIGKYASKNKLKTAIDNHFGDYGGFLKELSENNHRIVSIEDLGYMDTYDVNVQCPTADDKTKNSGHNFVVWSDDSYTGSGVVVSNTRNAAKMVVLDMDHPDILETKDGRPGFIRSKAVEEKLAHDMVDIGYNSAYDDPNGAYKRVMYQNANHSVSIPDAFMEAVKKDGEWETVSRTDGKSIKKYKAKDIWKEIAEAAWVCGDPGVQFTDTINEYHTTPNAGRINASNPCSEYLHIDNTACNLAAINLVKFFDDGKYNLERFAQAVKVFSISQMVMVDEADYPTEAIQKNSRLLRPIGTNYGNLGALIMELGYSYDSDEGRSIAAEMASLMTGLVYRYSSEIAEKIGAFPEFKNNKKEMLGIMKKHQKSDSKIKSLVTDPAIRKQLWVNVIDGGSNSGYYISQSSLMAPLGTISFLMGMSTTGIEPAFSLVSYKSMVGGGFTKLTNSSVPNALRSLGYSDQAIKDICEHIESTDSIEGAPGLKESDLPVFDCAMPTGPSGRYLTPMAHINMMAAIQPLITCAQSKTVNLPNNVTVDEIADIYYQSWKLGLKCVALYRDGCKASQPLSAKKDSTEAKEKASEVVEKVVFAPKREKLPDDVKATRHRFTIDGFTGYITVGEYEDGRPGEVFLKLGKPGSTISGLINGYTQLLSLALQYGIPLPKLIESFIDTKFEPAGMTSNKQIRFTKSLYDYLFKYLDIRFESGKYSGLGERLGLSSSEETEKVDKVDKVDKGHKEPAKKVMGPPCMKCGGLTQRAGACWICGTCGTSSGCS